MIALTAARKRSVLSITRSRGERSARYGSNGGVSAEQIQRRAMIGGTPFEPPCSSA
jgi:hypothetical protein